MAPVEKSFAVMGAVLPKLTPMVKGAASELDRFVTVLGGGISTGSFDAVSKKVGDFANQTLKGATDKAIHFMRALSEGDTSGPIASFFEYARAQGPATKALLTSIAEAVSNLLQGAAQAGPGLLTLVNAMAKLVASVPPEFIGTIMQVYAGLKLIKLAGAGVGAIAGGYANLAGRLTALRAAATAAGGGMTGLTTAIGSLSTGGKATLALGVVGALALAMHKLSDNKPAVQVDELSTALNQLATTGKVTGALKENFDEISASIAMVSKSASDNSIATMISDFGTWIGISKGPGISDAKKNVDAWDKSMANLVRAGHTKEAAAQYEILKRAWMAGGGDVKRLQSVTNDYQNSLKDVAFEQRLAAESQGLFGTAAQAAQQKLDAQKASADGLRQSIMALNEAHRSAFDAETKFEAAIDAATQSIKDNGATMDVHSAKGRANRDALSQLAAATEEAAAKARENGESWSTIQGIYDRGRQSLLDSAQAMGQTKGEAEKLASTLLNMPKDMQLTLRTETAIEGLNSVIAAIRKTPDKKSVTVKALTGDAVGMLRDLGFKVEKLKDGTFKVTAKTAAAAASLAAVQRARDALQSKTITIAARDQASARARAIQAAIDAVRSKTATITLIRRTIAEYNTIGRPAAGEGGVSKFASGGHISGGSGTQDDVPILAMGGEYIINKRQTRKYLPLLEAINNDRVPKFAKGGLTAAEKEARGTLRASFGQSTSVGSPATRRTRSSGR
jgi:hypothetical protein